MSAPADDITVHQITCDRCPVTVHVGTRPSALTWSLGSLGWATNADGIRRLCPDCVSYVAAVLATKSGEPSSDDPTTYTELSKRPIGSTVRLTDQELTEAGQLIENGEGDLIADEVILALLGEARAARTQLAEIRSLAATWSAQVPVDDAAVQQIEDGCALLLLIDGRTLPEEPR
jgi:hypothetical protein